MSIVSNRLFVHLPDDAISSNSFKFIVDDCSFVVLVDEFVIISDE